MRRFPFVAAGGLLQRRYKESDYPLRRYSRTTPAHLRHLLARLDLAWLGPAWPADARGSTCNDARAFRDLLPCPPSRGGLFRSYVSDRDQTLSVAVKNSRCGKRRESGGRIAHRASKHRPIFSFLRSKSARIRNTVPIRYPAAIRLIRAISAHDIPRGI